jgi:hypothetical protein
MVRKDKGKSSMPKGKCPRCGTVYYGLGLLHGQDTCEYGEKLVIAVNEKETVRSDKNYTEHQS